MTYNPMTMEKMSTNFRVELLNRSRLSRLATAARQLFYAKLLLLAVSFFFAPSLRAVSSGASVCAEATLAETPPIIVPRMMEAERTQIAAPTKGQLVFQIDGKIGYWVFDGKTWAAVEGEALNVVESSDAGKGQYLVKTSTGIQFAVHAPVSKQVVRTELSNGMSYDFIAQITIREGREESYAARVRGVFPNLSKLEIKNLQVHAEFGKHATEEEVNAFFNLLGCNFIQPIN